MSDKEKWKDIPGYEDRYQVSDQGKVFSKKDKKIVKLRTKKSGNDLRETIKLYKDKKKKQFGVHRLVMLAFKGYSNLHIDHKNNNPIDNRLCNLRYCTNIENNTVYRHKVARSGIRNVAFDKRTNNYYLALVLNNKKYNFRQHHNIEDVAMDYLIAKLLLQDIHPEYFKHPHPLEKYLSS